MAKYFQKRALWKSVTGSSIVDIFIYTLEDLIGTTFPEIFKSFGLYLQKLALREKCPYSELFWSDFFQGEKKKTIQQLLCTINSHNSKFIHSFF